MSLNEKHERRKEQNREAQRKFRLKKALVVVELEEKLTKTENKAVGLEQEVSELQKTNATLRVHIKDLLSRGHDTTHCCTANKLHTIPPKVNSPTSPILLDTDTLSASPPTNPSTLSVESLKSIISENDCDKEPQPRIESPLALRSDTRRMLRPQSLPSDSSNPDTPQISRGADLLFDDALDISNNLDAGRLHPSASWREDYEENSDSEPFTADIQVDQGDSQLAFLADQPETSFGSQIQSNGPDTTGSFNPAQNSFNLPCLQQNAIIEDEWPPIEQCDARPYIPLPCHDIAPIRGVPETYNMIPNEWSLSDSRAFNSALARREHFSHRHIPYFSSNDPAHCGFNYAMPYPALCDWGDQQLRQHQNFPAMYPTMPLNDPSWTGTDIVPWGKFYFGQNFAVT